MRFMIIEFVGFVKIVVFYAELFSFRYHLGHGLTLSIVGRSERSDLRHGNLNIIGHVGGRYARFDLQYSLFTITDVNQDYLDYKSISHKSIFRDNGRGNPISTI